MLDSIFFSRNVVGEVGPVSMYMCVDESFHHYHHGVYETPNCCDTTDGHAPVIVGYGTDKKHGDYWLVKNSWGLLRLSLIMCRIAVFILLEGTSWGIDGYAKFRRGENMCDIGYYAVVS